MRCRVATEFSQFMPSKTASPAFEDVDLPTLGRALWRAKGWVLGLAIGAGIVTFIGLSMMRPLYTSESRILIENDISAYTRPAGDQGRDQLQTLDEQAVQSQVQVLTSRDLALDVTKALDLPNNPEFAKDAGVSLFKRLMTRMGIGRGSAKSEQEKAADAFEDHLAVYALNKSSVIAVDYTSGDSTLAADAANELAEAYINWQRNAKVEQTKDATTWLSTQIGELRAKVAESEAAVEKFRASSGLYAGSNNVTLNAQQLSELNSQLILAAAQKSEAEARARLIKKMLNDNGDIDATPEVLKSELIARLIEQRVQVQRQLAELSATLLPSHPRIKQLTSELAGVRTQIKDEANKIVRGLENEAEVATVRETSLRNSLNDVKSQASGQSDSEIKLRALEREAKANRDLLESYLARYRDAAARHDMGSVPANATIVSRAHTSTKPSFPKVGPITLLVTAATALLAFAYVLARETLGATVPARQSAAAGERLARRSRPARAAPNAPSAPPAEPEWPLTASPPVVAETVARSFREAPAPVEPPPPAPEPSKSPAPGESFMDWLHKRAPASQQPSAESATKPSHRAPRPSAEAPAEAASDLRRYLPGSAIPARPPVTERSRNAVSASKSDKVGPVLRSLDAVLNHVVARTAKDATRIVLVAPVATATDATAAAIELARALTSKWQPVVLVDLTRGAAAVSGPLGLPRAPGFTDLAAHRASFENVVQVDSESPLQVIPAGNPAVKASGEEAQGFLRIFEALTQTYECVVLHADADTARKVGHMLDGRQHIVIAVLPAGVSGKNGEQRMQEFASPGSQVLGYEQSGGQPRTKRAGLLGRVAAG
jgi:uncharacterized protein involved in exopolysaccharide biosynthesis/Mrp family chromosome partitioning ATPase